MIIGISKKRLREWKRIAVQKGLDGLKSMEMLDLLITECTDLDHWLPIDENTPKDIEVLLYYENYNPVIGFWRNSKKHFLPKVDPEDYDELPTHYKLLPKDPHL